MQKLSSPQRHKKEKGFNLLTLGILLFLPLLMILNTRKWTLKFACLGGHEDLILRIEKELYNNGSSDDILTIERECSFYTIQNKSWFNSLAGSIVSGSKWRASKDKELRSEQWLKLVRVARIGGQGCFHHFGLTMIPKWDHGCVALVSVIRVACLWNSTVFVADIALGGSNNVITQLHLHRIAFLTEVWQMVHKFRSHWRIRIRNILPVVQRDNNSDISLHNVFTGILGGSDDPGSNSGTHAFVVSKNGLSIITCYKKSLNKNGQDSPENQVGLHLVFTFETLKSKVRAKVCVSIRNVQMMLLLLS